MKKSSKSQKLFLEELTKNAMVLKSLSRGLSIGELIVIVREQLGISQAGLAKRAKIPQKTVSHIESSKNKPNLATLEKLLNALSCEVVLVPLLLEPVDTIRRKQARRLAEKKVRYLRGTMSLEQQEPDKKLLDELIKAEEEELLHSSGKKLWQE